MITFRGRVSFPKLDAAKYTKALRAEIDVQVRQAAREWLRAVIPKVPVWAGTSRGSLKPLGRFLKVAIPIAPVVVRKNKGPSVGEAQGGFSFEHRGKRTLFKFSTSVVHFLLNEYYDMKAVRPNLIQPTPWNAFKAGEAAFNAYIAEFLPKRIPKIKDFIRYKSKRLDPP